jgi:hypothetical protein
MTRLLHDYHDENLNEDVEQLISTDTKVNDVVTFESSGMTTSQRNDLVERVNHCIFLKFFLEKKKTNTILSFIITRLNSVNDTSKHRT